MGQKPICRLCGETFERIASSQRYCPPCGAVMRKGNHKEANARYRLTEKFKSKIPERNRKKAKAAREKNATKPGVVLICDVCKQPYTSYNNRVKFNRFCSRECRQENHKIQRRNGKYRYKPPPKEVSRKRDRERRKRKGIIPLDERRLVCVACGTEFIPTNPNSLCCSELCKISHRQYMAAMWRLQNKEHISELRKSWRQAHPGRSSLDRPSKRRYESKNREVLNAKSRARYHADIEKSRQTGRKNGAKYALRLRKFIQYMIDLGIIPTTASKEVKEDVYQIAKSRGFKLTDIKLEN